MQSVTGPVRVEDLGFVLPHEHVFIDQRWVLGLADWPLFPADQPITLGNVGLVRRRSHSVPTNLVLDEPAVAADELARYRAGGGSTIVELTPRGLTPDPPALAAISRETGVTIVCSTGYYKQTTHPPELLEKAVGEVAREFIDDLTAGIAGSGIRAGVIGEIGIGTPVHPEELKVLRAAAVAAKETGSAVWVHLSDDWATGPLSSASYWSTAGSPAARSAPTAVDTILQEGLDPSRVVLCHMDLTADDGDYQRRLAERGVNLEFDTFGAEWGKEEWRSPMPSDLQRIGAVRRLFDHGHGSQVLISHDACTKVQWSAYGGHGYTYIPESIIPLMLARGFADDEIELITRRNPGRLLSPAA